MSCSVCENRVAEFYCSIHGTYLCREDINYHKNSYIFHKIDEVEIKESNAEVMARIQNIESAKLNIISETKKLIFQIKKLAKSTLNRLDLYQEKIRSLLYLSKNEKAENSEIEELNSQKFYVRKLDLDLELREIIKRSFSGIYDIDKRPLNQMSLLQKTKIFNQRLSLEWNEHSEIRFSDNGKYVFDCKIYLGTIYSEDSFYQDLRRGKIYEIYIYELKTKFQVWWGRDDSENHVKKARLFFQKYPECYFNWGKF